VGGAIGGAAAALLLAERGAEVTCFERVAEPRAVGAGIALQPNGMAVLAGLGLHGAIDARASLLGSPRIVDASGRCLLEPRLPLDAAGFDRIRMIRRSDLHEILLGAVTDHPRIRLHVGTPIEAVGANGTVEGHGAFHLVIGADGVHSRVRRTGGFGGVERVTGIWYVRGLIDRPTDACEEAWTSAGVFGRFPVPGGTYFFASAGLPALEAAIAAGDLGALRERWTHAYPPAGEVLGAVESFDALLVNEVIRVDCKTFVDGKVALLGDAAHAMAPNLGQGANSALVDGAVLCEELDRADELASGLTAYDRRRRPAVRKVQRAAATLGSLAERTNPVVRWLRDRLIAAMPTGGIEKRIRETFQEAPTELLRMASAPSRRAT
jgi:2-polyprenyl-6-methoxyphenol hydroxylase-like FAD-dependent oxidoreductase